MNDSECITKECFMQIQFPSVIYKGFSVHVIIIEDIE